MKKALSVALVLVLCLSFAVPMATAADLTAKPTASTVFVNEVTTAFEAYNINDNNFFKLRDLAFVLSGTEKQFSVAWDAENNAISLTSGEAYEPVGGEMEGKGEGTKTPAATDSTVYIDGEAVELVAYHIEGNNYFKLRDIAKLFDIFIGWDSKNIHVITAESYDYDNEGVNTDPPTVEEPEVTGEAVFASKEFMEVVKSYDYYSICRDEPVETVGELAVGIYEIMDSNNDFGYAAKEGFEWRMMVFMLTFSDDNAFDYGWLACFEEFDYYTGERIIYDDDYNFEIVYNGETVSCKSIIDSLYSGLNEDLDTYMWWVTVAVQVPVGYDGITSVFYNVAHQSTPGDESTANYVAILSDPQTLYFRYGNV